MVFIKSIVFFMIGHFLLGSIFGANTFYPQPIGQNQDQPLAYVAVQVEQRQDNRITIPYSTTLPVSLLPSYSALNQMGSVSMVSYTSLRPFGSAQFNAISRVSTILLNHFSNLGRVISMPTIHEDSKLSRCIFAYTMNSLNQWIIEAVIEVNLSQNPLSFAGSNEKMRYVPIVINAKTYYILTIKYGNDFKPCFMQFINQKPVYLFEG